MKIIKGEKGQALPIVLALLVLGGLIITPCLSLASDSLRAGKIVKENVKGVFAADAGVEHAIWCIKHYTTPPQQLPVNVNQLQVAIQFEDLGPHTLAYFAQVLDVSSSGHYDWIAVEGEVVWDEGAEAYQYTITVTLQPECTYANVHLEEVGARLPVGYSYEPGSAASFADNLSTDEPADELDAAGAHMLSWELPPPRPSISQEQPVATQTFYTTGESDLVGDYTWVLAARQDIGTVGEVTGTLFRINATATRPTDGIIIATVKAEVIFDEGTGETRIILWQINPQ